MSVPLLCTHSRYLHNIWLAMSVPLLCKHSRYLHIWLAMSVPLALHVFML